MLRVVIVPAFSRSRQPTKTAEIQAWGAYQVGRRIDAFFAWIRCGDRLYCNFSDMRVRIRAQVLV